MLLHIVRMRQYNRSHMHVQVVHPVSQTVQLVKMKLQFIYALWLILQLFRVSRAEPPVVTTKQGRIVGTRLEFNPPTRPELRRSVNAFLGIPYAEPPVGPLRFKPPVPKSWSGDLWAAEVGNRCPQPLTPMGNSGILTGKQDEDCLFIDVFLPQPVPAKAAVLVYIHGGGFIVGAGTRPDFYGTQLAAVGDVIVVALNYRLGALGFLSTGDDVVPGNMGLFDQRLALEWIRDNIEAFGGDSGRVTIFGESAGAVSVSAHVVSPGSVGLFHAAIMESGDISAVWGTLPTDVARRRAFALGKLVNCERETSRELLDCLQRVPFKTLVENQFQKLLQELSEAAFIVFAPVVDGDFFPRKPSDLYAEGAVNDAATILGSTAGDGATVVLQAFPKHTDEAPFVDSDIYDSLTRPWISLMSGEPIVADAVKAMYRNASCSDAHRCDFLESTVQALGDAQFVCPQDFAARALAKAGRMVYRYHMTHAPSSHFLGNRWTRTAHADEVPFVFGLPLMASDRYRYTKEEADMSLMMIRYWANMAKSGNPNLSSLNVGHTNEETVTEWPAFTLEELAYKDLSPAMPNGHGIKAKECLLWNEFIPKLVQLAEEAKKFRECAATSYKRIEDDFADGTCTKNTCTCAEGK
ncbi:acetylcholinesterase-like [Acanthaster planci]|uniref:Carboxylic ester hydrolase n=1 Tax=Acanthaster planci TaxID=133434 RepID=A0A8B8A263_ACAPL|nr:acetylcholinesterase-like [Acanthaster planci]